jgi:GTPase
MAHMSLKTSEDYDTTGRIMKVRGLPGAIARLRRTLVAS